MGEQWGDFWVFWRKKKNVIQDSIVSMGHTCYFNVHPGDLVELLSLGSLDIVTQSLIQTTLKKRKNNDEYLWYFWAKEMEK